MTIESFLVIVAVGISAGVGAAGVYWLRDWWTYSPSVQKWKCAKYGHVWVWFTVGRANGHYEYRGHCQRCTADAIVSNTDDPLFTAVTLGPGISLSDYEAAKEQFGNFTGTIEVVNS